MNEDIVERLELKITFLERTSAELSEVVYSQQRQIDALRASLAELASRMATLSQGDRPYSMEEEKPPHY